MGGPAGARYCRGRIAGAVTRSKASRTFYACAASVRDIESYVESLRAWAVRKARTKGRYDRLVGTRLVTEVTGGLGRRGRWIDSAGRRFEQGLDAPAVVGAAVMGGAQWHCNQRHPLRLPHDRHS